jgi:hypothetical protein
MMWVPKIRTRNHLIDPAVNGRKILKWIFKETRCKCED